MKKKKAAEPADDKKKADPMEKLLKLTKLLKQDKVSVEIKGAPARGPNKWRSYDPKFGPKPEKSQNVVQAGGMEVDPSLKNEYENWRKDKEALENDQRMRMHRKALAAAKERAQRNAEQEPPAEPPPPAA